MQFLGVFMSKIFKLFIIFFILVFIISIFFIPTLPYLDTKMNFSQIDFTSEFLWPTPEYTGINSYFGKRVSPTAGASSFHKGIDIGAPQGSNLIAITSGKISFTGFFGRWRIYYNFNKWLYENYLLSCFSTLHCKRRRYS